MTTDKRRIAACLKACEGISTQNLEDNVPFLELARRYNVVLRERDAAELMSLALRAKITEMERQEPVATVDANDEGYWAEILPDRSVRVGQKLYALPGAQGEEK